MAILPPNVSSTGLRGGLAAFWRGFVTPSRFALSLMIAICVTAGLLACAIITPATLVGPMGEFLPRSSKDTEAFATREALRLALSRPTDAAPRLYLISDSVLAHAFASDTLTAQAMSAVTRRPWEVAFLTTPLQGPLDEAALAEYATKQRPGVVVLSLGFSRFGAGRDDMIAHYRMGRVGVRSDWADQAVTSLGGEPQRRTGVYAIDNRNFLLRNINIMAARALVGQPAVRRIDSYLPHPPLDAPGLAIRRAAVLRDLRGPMRADDIGVRVFADTVRRLKANGNSIVFVEDPISEALYETPSDRARYAAYLKRSAAFASSLGGAYCQLSNGFQPKPAAFPDYIHVDDLAAQAKLRHVLAECVESAIKVSGAS